MPNQTTLANRLCFFLICSTLVFVTLAYGGVHQPVLAIFYILIAAIAVAASADALRSKELWVDRSLLQVPLFLAASYGLIQVIPFGNISGPAGLENISRTISIDPFSTEINALHFLGLAIFFSALLISLNKTARIRSTIIFLIVFGFLFAFFAILQSILSPGKIYGIYGNVYAPSFGSFVNRNNFAAFMEMSICLPLGMLFTASVDRAKRLLYITAVSLMGIALLLSGSRGGFVAMLAGLILIVLLAKRSAGRKQVVLQIALVAALLVTIIGGAIVVGGETSLARFAESAQSGDAPANRLHIWRVTLDVIRAHMPLGSGFGTFGVAFTRFDTNGGVFRVEQAHNDYLQIAADAGLPGVAIGVWFLFLLIRTGFKNVKNANDYTRGVAVGSFAGCCAVIVHSIFDFVLHTTAISLLFLVLAGLLVASGRADHDSLKRKRASEKSG
jgi:O-antigen ligase